MAAPLFAKSNNANFPSDKTGSMYTLLSHSVQLFAISSFVKPYSTQVHALTDYSSLSLCRCGEFPSKNTGNLLRNFVDKIHA